jgi:quercetin dioxygenase-like cupin family protein
MKPIQPSLCEATSPRQVLDVLGPTLEFLLPPAEIPTAYSVTLGTIPPDVVVPLHSHIDDESFYQLRGTVEVLLQHGDALEWKTVDAGDFVHIPGNTKHAWRNAGDEPAVQVLIMTARLARFLQEVGRPVVSGLTAEPPTREQIAHFTAVATRMGYWVGGPEENAAVGLNVPG